MQAELGGQPLQVQQGKKATVGPFQLWQVQRGEEVAVDPDQLWWVQWCEEAAVSPLKWQLRCPKCIARKTIAKAHDKTSPHQSDLGHYGSSKRYRSRWQQGGGPLMLLPDLEPTLLVCLDSPARLPWWTLLPAGLACLRTRSWWRWQWTSVETGHQMSDEMPWWKKTWDGWHVGRN